MSKRNVLNKSPAWFWLLPLPILAGIALTPVISPALLGSVAIVAGFVVHRLSTQASWQAGAKLIMAAAGLFVMALLVWAILEAA